MMAKIGELRAMPEGELQQKLADVRKELRDLRLKARQGQLDQPHRIAFLRRDIARMLTLLREEPAAKPAAK